MTKMRTDMCRICLKGGSDINIFCTEALNDLVANLLIDCADIEVSSNDLLPHVICSDCLELLKSSCELRKQIRSSDTLLRDMLEIDITKVDELFLDDNNIETEPIDNKTQMVVHTYTSSQNSEIKAEILTSSNVNIPIVEEINPYIDHNFFDDQLYDWDEIKSEDEDIADWILKPQQKSLAIRDHHCCMCINVYNDFESLKKHAQNFHKIQSLSFNNFAHSGLDCKVCYKIFSKPSELKKHETAFQQIACSECGKLIIKSQLRHHQRRHVTDQLECEICHKMIRTIYMSEHKKKVHPTVSKWLCNKCPGKSFCSNNYLQKHMARRHDKNFKRLVACTCQICGQQFETKSIMRDHMRIHTGEKKFSCTYCRQTFLHHSNYRRHLFTHEGSPYSCKKCNKYMDRREALKAHKAAGCSSSVASITRQLKPKEEDQEKITSKHSPHHPSTTTSIKPNIAVINQSFICGDPNCMAVYSTEADFALHMAMHATELKITVLNCNK